MATPPPTAPSTSGLPKVIIVLLVLAVACVILSVCVIVVLALLGPSVGNVFSNVITTLGTPAP